ncbi:type II toxin-antitoxin system VapC family toxin [Paenibacillus agricola]|uniref:Type II toxin-antitoxin system VapC family toxin n=1 Tax=Paenibacillus agricola TaxID=2716264 RepID=A0ABX0J996_9BACL|nr:type II toxin-antitoxin system VapC family toxin [Paenibacillus agricola]NHN30581.1 type II toxin-antitoxin system VapC family toxin [Paenibacillus agricola]
MLRNEEQDFRKAVFLDQSALSSLMDEQHIHYSRAKALFLDLDDLERPLITTNYIVFDTHQWLRNSFGFDHAQFFIDIVDQSAAKGIIKIIPGSPELEQESKQLISSCPDLRLSLSEALTAVVMLSYQVKRIFTFNKNYDFLSTLDSDIKVMPSAG